MSLAGTVPAQTALARIGPTATSGDGDRSVDGDGPMALATYSIRSTGDGPSRFQAICARYWPKKNKLAYKRCNHRNSFPAIADLSLGAPTQKFPGRDKVMKMARKAADARPARRARLLVGTGRHEEELEPGL